MTASPVKTIGRFECRILLDGFFRLDGGAMFGVVPKRIWNAFYPSDDHNRIRLGLTSLLVKGEGMLLLVEGGIGEAFGHDEKLRKIYGIEKTGGLEADLADAGYLPEDVTHVVYTHLHWDHAGNACRIDDKGTFTARFPKARYFAQAGEWRQALSGSGSTRASYLPEILAPLEECGNLELIEGDYQVNDAVTLKLTGGHTAHHQAVIVRDGGAGVIFWGDLIPTPHHVHIPHIMAYDRFPQDTFYRKEELLEDTVKAGFFSAFPHGLDRSFGRIVFDGARYSSSAEE